MDIIQPVTAPAPVIAPNDIYCDGDEANVKYVQHNKLIPMNVRVSLSRFVTILFTKICDPGIKLVCLMIEQYQYENFLYSLFFIEYMDCRVSD